MNSKERKEARYIRRKNKRLNILKERSNKYCNINNVFCFHKVRYYANKCCNGVSYKKSTQNFKLHMFTIVSTTCNNIKNDNYVVGKTYKFQINERGKIRNIDAPHIKDRLVHKTLSNEILSPIYTPHMIYDNGASIKNKGFIFAIKRVKSKLYHWYRKYGLNGYVVLIDFSKFFPNCSHQTIHDTHRKYIFNNYTIKVIEDFLFICKGIALGVEIAQKEACIIPNDLDHFIDNQNVPVERYMDDTFLICEKYESAQKLLSKYYQICEKLRIKVNKNKTFIIPINKYFKYCKWVYYLNSNGKIKCIPHKDTIYRQRKKLKKMIKKKINSKEIINTRKSFIAYLTLGNSFKYIDYLYKTEQNK